MARIVSFVALVAIILVTGVLFLNVVWFFWLPLFLALVMALVFRPVYRWFLLRCRGHEYGAAFLTTSAIVLVVLAPLVWLLVVSLVQSVTLAANFDLNRFKRTSSRARTNLGLDMPYPNDFKAIASSLERLDQAPKAIGAGPDHTLIVAETLRTIWRLQRKLELPAKEVESGQHDFTPPWERDDAAYNRWQEERVREVWRDPRLLQDPTDPAYVELAADPAVVEAGKDPAMARFWNEPLVRNLAELAEAKLDDSINSEYRTKLQAAELAHTNFRQLTLGDPIRSWFLNMLNPSDEELEQLRRQALKAVNDAMLEFTIPTTQILTELMIGGGIMILGLFYFFADGPHMVSTLIQLSPLDERYQRQLIEQFDTMSRAVVVANLVNAVAHGVAGAIGYYFAGCESWILLSTITMLLALVPFIGAACVWMPVCAWLWLYDENVGAAIFLAVYGSTVLTAVDYGLRPLLLHGQANIHPLLALISVLGGVHALGPIGILVGPIIVVLLQTLLTMLQTELAQMDALEESAGDASSPAATAAEAMRARARVSALADPFATDAP